MGGTFLTYIYENLTQDGTGQVVLRGEFRLKLEALRQSALASALDCSWWQHSLLKDERLTIVSLPSGTKRGLRYGIIAIRPWKGTLVHLINRYRLLYKILYFFMN